MNGRGPLSREFDSALPLPAKFAVGRFESLNLDLHLILMNKFFHENDFGSFVAVEIANAERADEIHLVTKRPGPDLAAVAQ